MSPEPENPYPRRTLRRLETRAKIVAAASHLFRKVGYTETTMAAIADAADVHVTTLFVHFKAKRDLATTLGEAAIDELAALIDQSRGKIPFFHFFRAVVTGAATDYQNDTGPNIAFGHDLRLDPELAFGWLHYQERQIEMLANYIADDYGVDAVADPRPTLIATLLVASNTLAHDRWINSGGSLNLITETNTSLDLAQVMASSVLLGTTPTI